MPWGIGRGVVECTPVTKCNGTWILVSFSCVPIGFDLLEATGFEVARRKAQVRSASDTCSKARQ